MKEIVKDIKVSGIVELKDFTYDDELIYMGYLDDEYWHLCRTTVIKYNFCSLNCNARFNEGCDVESLIEEWLDEDGVLYEFNSFGEFVEFYKEER